MIKYLEWDSEFFKTPIYELKEEDINKLDINSEIENLVADNIVQCKLNITNIKLLEGLINHGFCIESVGITYKKTINEHVVGELEFAKKEDGEFIKNMSRALFLETRFKECYFGLKAAERLYSNWISAAIIGNYDDCCIVKKNRDGLIVGFVTVSNVYECIKVGLIAVGINYQRQGVGQELMKLVEIYALKNNIVNLEVTTQYKNIPACKMYQLNGYSVAEIFYWLYLKVKK